MAGLVLLVVLVVALPVLSLVMVLVMWGRLSRLRADVERLSAQVGALAQRVAVKSDASPVQTAASLRTEPSTAARGTTHEPLRPPSVSARGEATERRQIVPAPAVRPVPSVAIGAAMWIGRLKTWLLGGNTVVRVGVVLLFFGVAFLLNYVIDQGWLPIEARLTLAAAGGLVLAAVGWRLRGTRRDYGLVLQGGGIGIVYLTDFAAANMYDLIPAGAGLVLMVILVALSGALAVLQDARSLAILATLAGFLAPVLISRGGSHLALFSYYAVLDLGILAIAWFKAWRGLNLLGFVCTFIVGAAWGAQYYQPAYFASTEPFLVAFFLFYVAVPVLYATRRQVATRSSLDGSLLFGVPLVAFGLQSGLVRDFEHGLAFSALATGLFYVLLASALWRRLPGTARMLVEVFLALGIAFGTLAIPLAFDGRPTGASWALEGAGLVWIGVRQRRRLARVSGVLLQIAAGFAFISALGGPVGDLPVLNSVYLGALLVSLSGLFSAWCLDRQRAELHPFEDGGSIVLLVWGLLWWVEAGIHEIATHVPNIDHERAYLVFAAGTCAVLTGLRWRIAWPRLRFPVLLLLPVMAAIAVGTFDGSSHPLGRWGSLAWAGALVTHYWIQWRLESEWPGSLARHWHQGALWLVVFLASWELAWVVGWVLDDAATWRFVGWVVVPGAAVVGVPRLAGRLRWPLLRFWDAYRNALIPVVGVTAGWVFVASFTRGNPAPLPYVPVVNPLEAAQCLALAVLLHWSPPDWTGVSERARWSVWSLLAFVALNGVIARATHVYGGVDFALDALWASPRYQTAVAITWTVASLVAMLAATRLVQRVVWFAGAALLAAVVAKLFLVDLEDVGTVARIVSFVVVGILTLLIGYWSPLPPRPTEQTRP